MGYYVRSLTWKKSHPQWKLQFISYRMEDCQKSGAKKRKKEWAITPERWRSIGFHSQMTFEDARCRASQLNAQTLLKGQEERIKKDTITTLKLRNQKAAKIPDEFASEFEHRFIRTRDSETESGKRRMSRAQNLWRAAQRMISAIRHEPSEWFYYVPDIYDYFHEKQYSVRYISAVLKMANLWGFFIARKTAKPFHPISHPKGYERQRLIEAYYKKTRNTRRPSKVLLPIQLEAVYTKMNHPNFNWLFLSVWLGLRPQEVSNLNDRSLWFIETLSTGRIILWIYQTKIVALPPEDRWKPIPILYDEQRFSLRIIQARTFKRPIAKTMRSYFGYGTDLYAGRKGFVDLMLSKGQSLENISIWMGHTTLDRTWRSYKNKQKFHFQRDSFLSTGINRGVT